MGLERRSKLGRSELAVSPLCLGGNVFGWTIDERQSFAVLDAFLEAAGNFIDTADVYSTWAPGNVGGESETIIGRWLASRRVRDRVVVATKLGSAMPTGSGLSRAHIERAANDSLKRLGVERIDLLYAHRDDPKTPVEETVRAFDALVRQGKVRVVGASNFEAGRLAQSLEVARREKLARYEVLQPNYNLVVRSDYEGELQALCVREQISVAPYYGLAAGFLTGKYQKGAPPPDSARAQGVLTRYATDRGWAVLEAAKKVAERHHATLAKVALAWLSQQPGVTAPIASARTPEQLRELVPAADLRLTEADLRAFDAS